MCEKAEPLEIESTAQRKKGSENHPDYARGLKYELIVRPNGQYEIAKCFMYKPLRSGKKRWEKTIQIMPMALSTCSYTPDNMGKKNSLNNFYYKPER
ncbi:MAG: hypothetical protein IPP39_12510 [Chitinophagaceae bacterium]|nr:hypothetical protein [Chitinophagaceae bacterium]